MEFFAGEYDVLVIGAGHAGIEAGLAAARLGCSTVVFTIDMDSVGNCPCNPSIGGTAKGHLVREIDALGGEIGKTADECFLQSRILNRGKGPAVHSLRVQIDRNKYSSVMKHKLEIQDGLHLKQAEIIDIKKNSSGFWSVKTRINAIYNAKTVIIAAGTYTAGRIYIGETSYDGGPDGAFPTAYLGKALLKLGLSIRRFKTGTPARILGRSIDFSVLEKQYGDETVTPFSYDTDHLGENKIICYIGWTNCETKKVILENIRRSPLYSGKIKGVGPRYCPSIEDKFVRFKDKEKHQFFVEPCGINTEEVYLQGLSSSLPEDVQIKFYHTLKGFENSVIMRPAYAIEYDCVDPVQMNASLEFRNFPGLFGAGQINGSSGYEEAAAQGIIAGINAAMKVKGKPALTLDRASSYIGTLIDDLVSKGTDEPYRMTTSRSEYRLALRQDNAHERLTPVGREIGLITDKRWDKFCMAQEIKKKELKRIKTIVISPSDELNNIIVPRGTSPLLTGIRMSELLKRPGIDYKCLDQFDITRPNIDERILEQVEIEIKYEGYIKRQAKQIEEMRRIEKQNIPQDIDYTQISGLRLEAIEKLSATRPDNLGQASRISGVSPADISVLMIWMARRRKMGDVQHDERSN